MVDALKKTRQENVRQENKSGKYSSLGLKHLYFPVLHFLVWSCYLYIAGFNRMIDSECAGNSCVNFVPATLIVFVTGVIFEGESNEFSSFGSDELKTDMTALGEIFDIPFN